jgi:hypothetical protein
VEGEYRKKAKELAPDVLRAAAAKVGPKLDEMIEEFAGKLDAWVVTAGQELHQEVLEVLHATVAARAAGDQDDESARREVEEQEGRLGRARTHVEELRAALWVPKDRIRIEAGTAISTPGDGG